MPRPTDMTDSSQNLLTLPMQPISDRSLIRAHLGEWVSLHQAIPHHVPAFAGPALWLVWLEAFPEVEPAIFELRDEAGLRAVLPLYLDGSCFRLIGDEHLDYQDLLADSLESAIAVLRGALAYVASQNRYLSFRKVAESSMILAALRDEECSKQAVRIQRYWGTCPTACFAAGSAAKFLAGLSRNKKSAHRSATNKLKEAFSDSYFEMLGEEPFPESVLEQVAQLHRDNQHRKSGGSIFCDSRYGSFLQQQAVNGVPLRLSLLWEKPGGKLLCLILGYLERDTYFFYITSYQGAYHHLSPGRWLLVETLAHCADRIEGATLRLDLLTGLDAYKQRWAESYYNLYRVQWIPKGPSGFLWRTGYGLLYTAKGIKERLRQRLRPDFRRELRHSGEGG